MPRRLLILAALLGAEALIASLYLDGSSVPAGGHGLLGLLRDWGAWMVRWAVGFAAFSLTFAYLKYPGLIARHFSGSEPKPLWLIPYLGSSGLFAVLSSFIYSGRAVTPDLLVALWLLSAAVSVMSVALTAYPALVWIGLLQQLPWLWAASAVCSAAACWLGWFSRFLWEPATRTTFLMVKLILSGLVGQIVVQPGAFRIGTPRFTVVVSPECSGLEGIGLILIFSILWLVLFRKDLRFPQALVVVPFSIVALYLLNSVRIAALVLIGDAGWREIAIKGFHSQAGWIAFNLVAFGVCLGARRTSWLLAAPEARGPVDDADYPVAPYVIPFLSLLGAGILAAAMSSGFDWAYALRPIAGCVALWMFRERLRGIDWGFGWMAVLSGAAVFGIWIGFDRLFVPEASSAMPPPLAAAPASLRLLWIAIRVLGAGFVVPAVEELAFRGFGLRRLISEDFEAVPWRSSTYGALLGSSLLFGALHGTMWPAGVIAGVVYGLAMVRKGRLGDAVAAHSATNLLLAGYVLLYERFDLW